MKYYLSYFDIEVVSVSDWNLVFLFGAIDEFENESPLIVETTK